MGKDTQIFETTKTTKNVAAKKDQNNTSKTVKKSPKQTSHKVQKEQNHETKTLLYLGELKNSLNARVERDTDQIHEKDRVKKRIKSVKTNRNKINDKNGKFNQHEYCGKPIGNYNNTKVREYKNETHTSYDFSNQMTCKNVHRCITCYIKYMKEKAKEIKYLAMIHTGEEKNTLGFLTITQPTSKKRTSTELLHGIKKEWVGFQRTQGYKRFKNQTNYIGNISVTEETFKIGHNGHYHLHFLMFYDKNIKKENEIEIAQKELLKLWVAYYNRNKTGRKQAQLQAQNQKIASETEALSKYFIKWDVAIEMTGAKHKKNTDIKKGVNFWELARIWAMGERWGNLSKEKSDKIMYQQIVQHIDATHGTQKINISPNIYKHYGLARPDEREKEIEETETTTVVELSSKIRWMIEFEEIKPHILSVCHENKTHFHRQMKIYQLILEIKREKEHLIKIEEFNGKTIIFYESERAKITEEATI